MVTKEKDFKQKRKKIKMDLELKQKKARLLKLRLAGTGLPRFPSTSEARRGLVQDTKSPSATIEGNKTQTQNRIRQEVNFINKGKPIRPKGPDAKLSPSLKKRLAQIKLAREHGHSIVFKGNPLGVYRAASLEGQQGKYAKYWLLNAKQTNGNGWGISAKTAKENMKKFIGRPLVVTSAKWHGASVYGDRYEHPYLPTDDLNQIFAHQEQFRVGNIVDVEDHNGDYYATIEMLPRFANMTLPPFCSPAIYQLDAMEHEGDISKWEALHLAALDENPAYGARIALLKGTCVGTENSCKVQFKSAKLQTAGVNRNTFDERSKHITEFTRNRKKGEINEEAEGEFIHDYLIHGEKINPSMTTAGKKMKNKKQYAQITCPIKLKERIGKLKKNQKIRERLASLGEQNMTYQKSKKIKIHKKKHPEVRKAKKSVEDILRGFNRSVDGSHAQSSFLSTRGDFVGGLRDERTHADMAFEHDKGLEKILVEGKGKISTDSLTEEFSRKNGLIQVQNFPINRAGDRVMNFGIFSKPNKSQLKSIIDSEKSGRKIGFNVGGGESAITGSGSRDLMKALREKKLL